MARASQVDRGPRNRIWFGSGLAIVECRMYRLEDLTALARRAMYDRLEKADRYIVVHGSEVAIEAVHLGLTRSLIPLVLVRPRKRPRDFDWGQDTQLIVLLPADVYKAACRQLVEAICAPALETDGEATGPPMNYQVSYFPRRGEVDPCMFGHVPFNSDDIPVYYVAWSSKESRGRIRPYSKLLEPWKS